MTSGSTTWEVDVPRSLGRTRRPIAELLRRTDGPFTAGSGDIIEVVLLVPMLAWFLLLLIGAAIEWLLHLLWAPFRWLLFPDVRAAGWGFDLRRIEPFDPRLNPEYKQVTTTTVRVADRDTAKDLAAKLKAHLGPGSELTAPPIQDILAAASADVTAVGSSRRTG